jgi:S-DNA-T family DNA segregation ATPase FtsK/SpoIIIE
LAASITPRSGGVHIYGLDFAGGGLGLLEPLPNVGSIIDGGDDERIARFFRWLRATADERAVRYSAAKAPTLSQYRRVANDDSEPRLLVLIDGMGAFKTSYEATTERAAVYGLFQQLVVDGRGVGLHFAVTGDRPSAIPTSLAPAFQRKIVLRMTDDDGYVQLGLPKDVLSAVSPPGRAMQVGRPQELQLAILGDNINVVAQSRTIAQLAEVRASLEEPSPYRVAALRSEIPAAEMPAEVDGRPVVGVADATLAPLGFAPNGPVIVWGPAVSGRTTAVHWLASALRAWRPRLPLVHLTPKRSPLSASDIWTMSATGMEQCEQLLQRLRGLVDEERAGDDPNLAVLVESYPEFLSSKVESLLAEVVKSCRRNGHLLVAEGEASTWGTWPLHAEVRNARAGLLLQPDSTDGDSILRTSLPRFKKGEPPPGRGWWIQFGKAHKIQVPLVE